MVNPGIIFYCTTNPDKLDLDTISARALEDKDNKVIFTGDKTTFGEVVAQPINVEGLKDGDYYKEPYYVAVSKDGNRLLFIQLWGVPAGDSLNEALTDDVGGIFNNLKFREVEKSLPLLQNDKPTTNNTTNTGNTQTTTKPKEPTCTQFKIYEGDFKSDKCYSANDYKDLQYYLQQYNRAAFDYNAAVSGMRITCNGSEFFEDECEEDKDNKDEADEKMDEYKEKIKSIIAKGK